MTPEERRILSETRQLAEENNEMLRKIQRSQRASLALKTIYWLVIIGLSVGAFWFIQPYVNAVKESVGTIGGAVGL